MISQHHVRLWIFLLLSSSIIQLSDLATAAVKEGKMILTSASGILSLLEEPTDEVKSFALKRLDNIVDEFWPEISESVEKIEILFENKNFREHKLAGLIASKIYYHLGSFDDSLTYALGASDLFDINSSDQYVETILSKCIDQYIFLRSTDFSSIDSRLESIVNRIFERCLAEKKYKEALGIAIETKRLDILQESILRSQNNSQILDYAFHVAMGLVQNRAFRNEVLQLLVEIYLKIEDTDYIKLSQCIIHWDYPELMTKILKMLIEGGAKLQLTAYQIAFDLYESATQKFVLSVLESLKPNNEGFFEAELNKLKTILSGEKTIELHLQFLIRSNKTDFLIMKQTKDASRSSICQTGVLLANAFMNAGTTSDYFLRENLEWLSHVSNWSKMTAVASLGVIHRGHENDALNLMRSYLPQEVGSSAGYTESGALYALGIIYANHGLNIIDYLVQQLKDAPNEIIKHGGCLGLGLAALGTRNEEIYEQIKCNLYEDNAVVGEAAGIAMGLVMLGSNNEIVLNDMISYSSESQHEKILRGLAIGIALVVFGQLENADETIENLISNKDPILRRSGAFSIGMAYCGSNNNNAIRKLLHIAVSDVKDDVRRAAVISLGFILFKNHEQCPNIVSLLAESHNPHVRYGAAMALGIACAGTGKREAISILEPMMQSDRVNFVRQGALIASAMICVQQTEETCSKVSFFRKHYAEVIRDKHEDVMAKFGAILAQGILDAGGRNTTLCLQSRSGHINMLASVATLIFTQYWYWFPLTHFLALAFTPTCLIALNADLNMPKMQFKSNSRPSMFAYPSPTEVKKQEEIIKTSSALLSIAARRGRREKYKLKLDADEKQNIKAKSRSPTKSPGRKSALLEKEPEYQIINNPGRVMQQQLKGITLIESTSYCAIKNPSIGGIIMVYTECPENEEIVELVGAYGPEAEVNEEPDPPEAFELNESLGQETCFVK